MPGCAGVEAAAGEAPDLTGIWTTCPARTRAEPRADLPLTEGERRVEASR